MGPHTDHPFPCSSQRADEDAAELDRLRRLLCLPKADVDPAAPRHLRPHLPGGPCPLFCNLLCGKGARAISEISRRRRRWRTR